MSVLVKEDSHEKEDLRGEKKHSVHVTTFITSFIYMYVHGDLDQPDKQIWNVSKLQARLEDTDAEKVYTQISNTNVIKLIVR